MITLAQLLESRDRRAAHQRELLRSFPSCTIVCLTVQTPGPEKRTPESLIVGGAGLAAVLDSFGSDLLSAQVRDLDTGYEAYFALPLDALQVKRICCDIEDTHPLGRLMDIDVIPASCADAQSLRPLGREDIGLQPCSCFLCDAPARECMRSRTHSYEEIAAWTSSKIKDYLSSSPANE